MEGATEKIPIGQIQPLEGQKEMVELSQVDNEVIFVNEGIEAPFKIEVGKKSDLGLFFNINIVGEHTFPIEKIPAHGRAGLVGRVVMKDRMGNLYQDVDIKGIGYISQGHIFDFSGTPGILNLAAAEKEKNVSEILTKHGLRTSRVLAILKLKEIYDKEGTRRTIEEARNNKIIRETDEPVVEIRVLGSDFRIQDLAPQKGQTYFEVAQQRYSHLDDARLLIAGELSFDTQSFNFEKYLDWFVQNLGKQLAKMHNARWVHTGLTEQNITLDGRIVDFATSQPVEEGQELQKIIWARDIERATRSLKNLVNRVKEITSYAKKGGDYPVIEDPEEYIKKFRDSYLESLEIVGKEDPNFLNKLEGQIKWGME